MIKSGFQLDCTIQLNLNEGQARALEAICGYGPDSFVKWFYKNCGTHYLKPHEQAMRDLFAVVMKELPGHLNKLDKARAALREPIQR